MSSMWSQHQPPKPGETLSRQHHVYDRSKVCTRQRSATLHMNWKHLVMPCMGKLLSRLDSHQALYQEHPLTYQQYHSVQQGHYSTMSKWCHQRLVHQAAAMKTFNLSQVLTGQMKTFNLFQVLTGKMVAARTFGGGAFGAACCRRAWTCSVCCVCMPLA